jgi:two-component system, response regulator PdtaR
VLSSKGKILVVDDDRLVLYSLTQGLSQAGYEVIDADNGDDAILEARARRPDLALLDIRMEGKSGFDVAAYLREHEQVPFMFLSAFSDAETVAQVQALGALDHLIKPVDMEQILPAVAAAFARTRGSHGAEAGAVAPAVPAPRPQAAALQSEPLPTAVAIAVGVLMHRHSLSQATALDRLRALALSEGVGLQTAGERVVAAVELLSGGGAPH